MCICSSHACPVCVATVLNRKLRLYGMVPDSQLIGYFHETILASYIAMLEKNYFVNFTTGSMQPAMHSYKVMQRKYVIHQGQ